MNRLKKIGALLLSICLLVPFFANEAWAASGSVKVSSASGTVGSTVTVTCTASISGASMGGADVVLVYDASKLTLVSCSSGASGSSGGVYYSQSATGPGQKSLSFSVTFKILKEGSHSVSVTSAEIFDWDDAQSVATSKNGGTITGKAVTTVKPDNDPDDKPNTGNDEPDEPDTPSQNDTKDKNSKLSGLQIYPGSLAPAFSAGTTSYTVTVPEDTRDVTITATAQSSKARVSVSGGKNLQLGPNTAKVIVTAENGSTTVYSLTIMCGEVEKIAIEGKEYQIEEGFSDDSIPTGFAKETITYNERQYEGLAHEKGNLKLMCLKNSETGSTFFIYNPESQTFYNFIQISIAEGKYIVPIQLGETETFAGVEQIALTLQKKAINAWKLDEEFSVFRAMNQDGEEVFYRYDNVDTTFQRYAEIVVEAEPEPETEAEPVKKSLFGGYELYIIIALACLSFILFVMVIFFISTRNHKHTARRRKMQKKLAKQKEK